MGVKPCEISRQLRITHGCISKLLSKFNETGSIDPGNKNVGRPLLASNTEVKLHQYKAEHFETFSSEIKERLLKNKVCAKNNVPSLSSISRLVNCKTIEDAKENIAKRLPLQPITLEVGITKSELSKLYSDNSSNRNNSQCPSSNTSSEPTRPPFPFSIEAILSKKTHKPTDSKRASVAKTVEASINPGNC